MLVTACLVVGVAGCSNPTPAKSPRAPTPLVIESDRLARFATVVSTRRLTTPDEDCTIAVIVHEDDAPVETGFVTVRREDGEEFAARVARSRVEDLRHAARDDEPPRGPHAVLTSNSNGDPPPDLRAGERLTYRPVGELPGLPDERPPRRVESCVPPFVR
jgi:hypothetical protein